MAEPATEENMKTEEENGEQAKENGKEGDEEMVDKSEEPEVKPEGMDKSDEKDSSDGAAKSSDTKGANDQVESESSQKPVRSVEKEVGITQYVGKHQGFFGIIKQRYSDFHVNEVSSAGELVHLTDLTPLKKPEEIIEEPTEMPPELTSAKLAEIDRMLGNPLRIVATTRPNPDEMETSEEKEDKVEDQKDTEGVTEVRINVDKIEKDGRTNIHRALKSKYKNVDSMSREIDGKKYIVVRKKNAQGNKFKERTSWPKSQQYTTFVLYKENKDTITAINQIAYKIRLKPNIFAYAGTKDKRGKTSQMVSVSQVAPAMLISAARVHRDIFIGNFSYQHKPMKLGALQGNRFRIALREVKVKDEEIEAAVSSLKSQGFINYYGTQRFGTSNVPTHTIGRELLKSNWQEAINLILTPRDNDNSDVNQCCKIWTETKDPEKALEKLSRGSESAIEAQLLKALATQQKNDLVGAITKIPRNIRTLYLHAYQSYLWNVVASKRVETYGLAVLPGDLVRKKGTPVKDEEDEVIYDEAALEEDMETEESKTVTAAGTNSEGSATDSEKTTDEGTDNKGSTTDLGSKDEGSTTDSTTATESGTINVCSTVHVLTEEEAKQTDITEVLIPLPGHNIEFPENIIKEWFSTLLEEDGLSFSALKNKVKTFSVGGVYRRLITKPTEVTSKICYYNDPSLALIQSDIDKVRGDEVEENILTEGKHKAVILEMTLPPSSYATMALRELLKIDTSSEMQASLNKESSRLWQESKAHARENGQGRGDRSSHADSGRKRRWEEEGQGWEDRRGGRHSHRGGWGHGHRGGGGRGWRHRGRGGRGHHRWNDRSNDRSKRGRFF